MNPIIRKELKKIRFKIDQIPFGNKLKSNYVLCYVDIIDEIDFDEDSTIIEKLKTLNYLIDNNL